MRIIALLLVTFLLPWCSTTETSDASKSNTPLKASDITVVVFSQHAAYHQQRLERLKRSLILQATVGLGMVPPRVKWLQEPWGPRQGGWTLFPLVKRLAKSKWYLFITDAATVDLAGLLSLLETRRHKDKLFLGRGLLVGEPADRLRLSYHYLGHEFDRNLMVDYPDFLTGYVISGSLMKALANGPPPSQIDFNIMPTLELAYWAWKSHNVTLQDLPQFCVGGGNGTQHCATMVEPGIASDCGPPVADNEVFFAVKSTKKNHERRLKTILKTWVNHASNWAFFSDAVDDEVPTIDLGVPNVERGHCMKLLAILKAAAFDEKYKHFKWVVIMDDDTLVSPHRMRALLGCYNHEEPLFIGERYGYNHAKQYGYDYPTGGSGIAVSRAGLQFVIGKQECECHRAEAPDDMHLGSCLGNLYLPLIHRPELHQENPVAYPPRQLMSHTSVTFHHIFDCTAFSMMHKLCDREKAWVDIWEKWLGGS